MKFKFIIPAVIAVLLTSLNAYAKPSDCALSETCALAKGKVTINITPDDGDAYLCKATADTTEGKMTFSVKGGGKYKITTGAGTYEAAPTVDVNLVGSWKTKYRKPKAEGQIVFSKVKGGTGTVVCTAA